MSCSTRSIAQLTSSMPVMPPIVNVIMYVISRVSPVLFVHGRLQFVDGDRPRSMCRVVQVLLRC